MLAANTILQNRYRVVRQLGKGGMGAVYEAIDQRVSCLVAVKETLVGSDTGAQRAFEREASLLANLRHQSLPKVMDHFGEGGGEFLVMEFIPGYDLAELLELRGSPFPQDQVLRWGHQLLTVLDYLHTRNPPILHRDIKPSNLKLTKQGEVFLLDFGLAKGAAGQMPTLKTNESVHGYTKGFSPLEQILGQGTDERSDLYSLGATLYHLLTNTAPSDAPTRSAARDNGEDDPLVLIESLNLGVSRGITEVIYQAMAMNRRQRPSSARDMQRALRLAEEEDERQAAAEEFRRVEARRQQEEEEERRRVDEERRLQEAETRRREEEEARVQQEAAKRQREEAETTRLAEEQSKQPERDWREAEEAGRSRQAASTEEQHRIAKERARTAPRTAIVPEPPTLRAPEKVPMSPIARESRPTGWRASALMRNWRAVLIAAAIVAIIGASVLLAKQYWVTTQSQPGVETQPHPATPQLNTNQTLPTPPAGMVYVPSGTFMMGQNKSAGGDEYESPAHEATVKPFFIDIYEVTNEDYGKFVSATHHSPPRIWGGVYPQNAARHPVGVAWNDANDYALWARKRLPTEEEWEFVARGADGRRYPWGNYWRNGLANANRVRTGLSDVGAFKGASPFGVFDMAGNAWEWTATKLGPYAGGTLPAKIRLSDDMKVIRGGAYQSYSNQVTTTFRRGYPSQGEVDYDLPGFRCVKDIK